MIWNSGSDRSWFWQFLVILTVQILPSAVPLHHDFLHQSLLLSFPLLLGGLLLNPSLLRRLLLLSHLLPVPGLSLPQFLHLRLNLLRALFLWFLGTFSFGFLLF